MAPANKSALPLQGYIQIKILKKAWSRSLRQKYVSWWLKALNSCALACVHYLKATIPSASLQRPAQSKTYSNAGQIWFDRNVTKLLWQAQFDSNPPVEIQADKRSSEQPKLSDSERHIAYLACKGLSAKEISAQLLVTEKTVRNQLSVIYRKIGAKKQIELCLKAPLYNYFKESYLFGTFFPQDHEK